MTTPTLVQSFRHRENLDGTWDSICMRCYATAAHSHQEAVLALVELRHHCDEMTWVYKEPVGCMSMPSVQSRLASVLGRTCAPALVLRSTHQSGQPSLSLLRVGRPAGLREQASSQR